jgi:hypothetical protein
VKAPEEMTAEEINREIDKIDAASSKLNSEMIEAGYGHVKYWDTEKEAPEFWPRFKKLHDRRQQLRMEIVSRYGPGAPSRLPKGFGPRKRNPMAIYYRPLILTSTRSKSAYLSRRDSSKLISDKSMSQLWISREDAQRAIDRFAKNNPNVDIVYSDIEEVDGSRERNTMRSKNPGHKSTHTAKWDDCVKRVQRQGTAVDPYAVCTAAMGELSLRTAHRRSANPLPKISSVRRIFYAVTASKGREKYYLKRNGKLTRKPSDAARFSSVAEGMTKARAHLARYPASRSYKFDVGLAY